MRKPKVLPFVVLGAVLLLAAALAIRAWVTIPSGPEHDVAFAEAPSPPSAETDERAHPSFLYGRVTTLGGATFEGRLRFGGDEEAFWGDYYNGFKDRNPWAVHAPPGQLTEKRPIVVFGVKIAERERSIDLGRPFMTRFGDIERIDARGKDVRVTLKSGTAFDLDRLSAGDFDDGVRVWDGRRGVVDLDSLQIRTIARRSRDRSLVTRFDGREVVLSGTREAGRKNRGLYVDDPRYGRVLVSWEAFERVDFRPGGDGPAYDDFPPGVPLTGSVATRSGGTLAGRLVYDLDESETTETLDAPFRGVNYTIPFGRIASITLPERRERDTRHARVALHDGEELRLESAGDLGEGNAGLLVFVGDGRRPAYVPWDDVKQIRFERPAAVYPPLGRP